MIELSCALVECERLLVRGWHFNLSTEATDGSGVLSMLQSSIPLKDEKGNVIDPSTIGAKYLSTYGGFVDSSSLLL